MKLEFINQTIREFEDMPATKRGGRINQAIAALKDAREQLTILDATNEALRAFIKSIVQNN